VVFATAQPFTQYGPALDLAPARSPKRGQRTRSQTADGVVQTEGKSKKALLWHSAPNAVSFAAVMSTPACSV